MDYELDDTYYTGTTFIDVSKIMNPLRFSRYLYQS